MMKQLLCILFMMLVLAQSTPAGVTLSGEILGFPYDFDCLNDIFNTLFVPSALLKTIQLCTFDNAWRYTVKPLVKPWVRSKSD